MKFILIESEIGKSFVYYYIQFSKNLIHKEMYIYAASMIRRQDNRCYTKCVSAGFIVNDIYHGESSSMNISAHVNTKQVVDMIDYLVYDKSQF